MKIVMIYSGGPCDGSVSFDLDAAEESLDSRQIIARDHYTLTDGGTSTMPFGTGGYESTGRALCMYEVYRTVQKDEGNELLIYLREA